MVLPLTILFGFAKFGMHQLGWEPWAFDLLTAALFASATFIIAFILSGTLKDYTASVEMPIHIANALESIQDSNLLIAQVQSEYDPQALSDELVGIAQSILDWLQQDKPLKEVETALNRLNLLLGNWLIYGNAPIVSRSQAELARIRTLISAIKTNRDTSFLIQAYALLEIYLVGAIVALLLIRTDRFSESLMISCFLFTSFTYLLLLIRDLDNPFQYNGKSCVDVDLSALVTVCDRLQQSLHPQP